MSRSRNTEHNTQQALDTTMLATWTAALVLAFIVVVSLGVIFALDGSIVAIGLVSLSAVTKVGIDLMIRP